MTKRNWLSPKKIRKFERLTGQPIQKAYMWPDEHGRVYILWVNQERHPDSYEHLDYQDNNPITRHLRHLEIIHRIRKGVLEATMSRSKLSEEEKDIERHKMLEYNAAEIGGVTQ